MPQYGLEIVPAYRVNLKDKGGLRDAIIASLNNRFVVGRNPVQQAFLNKIFNRHNFPIV